ncbi:BTAD domain-containing putative transcriptional regulator [Patulibacter brassicae]|uniref:BTAD domain-containing putative transcriptional regulator n=1 Tax=Patulibacter brassicae TaxID=1705717 RepID=A0ABU4VGA2_9ACTN|nr:BTAD domain-containing putative transcriptional regulator [Patulibacter brassicae]MDX8150392.1 BTAD domain-containing putative transcriptional regulator [Patulibacter brassicae]
MPPGPAPLSRPRLEDGVRHALDDGTSPRPVVLVAPAGWGKTTVVAAALRGWPGPVAWHGCGPADADPGRLAVGLLRTVDRALPGAAGGVLRMLEEPGAAVDPRAVVDGLLRELARVVVEPPVLVLDDAEALGRDAATGGIVEALLDADPRTLRVVVAARRRPPGRLARRRAAGALLVLDEDDLRFDAEECAALLELRGAAAEPSHVAAALEATSGWPLGLVLGLSGDPAQAIEGYLEDEVLEELAPADRALLLDSSVDERLDDADASLMALLERLAPLGLVPDVLAAADGARVRRWHPLVRAALRTRWRRERPAGERRSQLVRAAEALERDGRLADAVDRRLEAHAHDAALAAILRAPASLYRASPATARRWLEALPDALRDSTDGRWVAARLAVAEGRLREAAAHDAAALRQLDGDRRDAALNGIAEAVYFTGDLDLAAAARDVLERPEALAGRPVALQAAGSFAVSVVGTGDVARGVALAERVYAQPGAEIARQLEVLLRTLELLPAGGHEAVRERLRATEADHRGTGFPEWLSSIRGFVEADVGHWDAAVEHARRMVARADHPEGTAFWQTLGTVQLGWALSLAGRWKDAAAVLEPLRSAAFDGWPLSWIDVGLARIADAVLDHAAVLDHVDRALRDSAGAPLLLRHLVVLGVVPPLARAGAADRALALIDATASRARERLGAEGARHALARLRAQRAWLRDAAGTPAEEDLRAAIAGGADVLRAEWAQLATLVWDGLEQGLLAPAPTVALVAEAFGNGTEALELAGHPTPAVRAAVVAVAAGSRHPSAAARLKALRQDRDPAVMAAVSAAPAPAAAPVLPLELRVLGPFEARRGPWRLEDRAWGRPTTARLVRFLLARGGSLVAQDVILDALWPDRPADAAKAQLQVAVSRARNVLDPPGTAPTASALRFHEHGYRLVLHDGDAVDAETFRAASRRALEATGPTRRAALEHAVGLWRGEPLPEERYAGWADGWIAELDAQLHATLAALLDEQRAAGEEAAVAVTAHRLLQLDDADEAAHRALIVALARTGRRGPALRQYLLCRRALVDGHGVEPSAETRALQAAVLSGRVP